MKRYIIAITFIAVYILGNKVNSLADINGETVTENTITKQTEGFVIDEKTFPDPCVRYAVIRMKIDDNGDGYINEKEADSARRIYITPFSQDRENISDIENDLGIPYPTNNDSTYDWTTLDCTGLENFKHLKNIYLGEHHEGGFKTVKCFEKLLSSSDIEYLEINNVQNIKKYDFLQLEKLKTLKLYHLKNIERIKFAKTNKLKTFYAYCCEGGVNFDFRNSSLLESIEFEWCHIGGMKVGKTNKKLRRILMPDYGQKKSQYGIKKMIISDLNSLEKIEIKNANKLSDFVVKNTPKLKKVLLSSRELKKVKISKCPKLSIIDIAADSISSVVIQKVKKKYSLFVANVSNIKSIKLDKLITKLEIGCVKGKVLDVRTFRKLKKLTVDQGINVVKSNKQKIKISRFQ